MLDWFLMPSFSNGNNITCSIIYIEGINHKMLRKIISSNPTIENNKKIAWGFHLYNGTNVEILFNKIDYITNKVETSFDDVNYMKIIGDIDFTKIIYPLLKCYYPNIKTNYIKTENIEKLSIIKVLTCSE